MSALTSHYLRRADAAHYVRETLGSPIPRKWLAKLALVGGRPIHRKAGGFSIYSAQTLIAGPKPGSARRSTSVEEVAKQMASRRYNPRR